MADRPTALVTGGAKRVGRAVVLALARHGWDVAFSYRASAAEAEQTRHDAVACGSATIALAADLADPTTAAELASLALRQLGRLDLLVNCASLYLPDDGPHGATPALQSRLLAVNCVAPATLMAECADALRQSGGAVVNFLDLLATRPRPSYSAYCASKAALHAHTLAAARRLAPEVRVNGIAPGVIDWPEDMPDADREKYLQRVPLARAGTPEDAADLVVWLATAAPYVTGQVIGLDGGRSLL